MDEQENSREFDAERTARYIPPPVPVLQLAPLMVPPDDVVPVVPSGGSCTGNLIGVLLTDEFAPATAPAVVPPAVAAKAAGDI